MSTGLMCIVCGRPLPPAARDGETLGPLICDRHVATDPDAREIIGFPNLDDEVSTGRLTDALRGQEIRAARRLVAAALTDLLLELDAGILHFFPRGFFGVFGQYVPRASISPPVVAQLPRAEGTPGAEGVTEAVNAGLAVAEVTLGALSDGNTTPSTLTLRFVGGAALDIEAAGATVVAQDEAATELVVSWRPGRVGS